MLDFDFLKTTFRKEFDSLLSDFFTFLRFQSISTDSEYRTEVHACAQWLSQLLKTIGLNVEVWKTEGAPVLFATDLRAGRHKETLLLYCHYDVQPVDPLNLWTTPPFDPHVREGKVYARGASDNKGQCYYTIRALKTLLENLSALPVNLKFLIEGEEESGSVSLHHLLEEKKETLKADHLLIIDSGLEHPQRPAISLGARGITTMTIKLTGSRFDLHSGSYGGIVYNPNRALVELLASLHDSSGRVTIPGFYDDVIDIPPQEKNIFNLEFDLPGFEKEFGAFATGMERGMTPHEAAWLRPTLEINGLSGGYGGPGFKTVIPSQAIAKVSCRLVPQQNPHAIAELVKAFLMARAAPGIKIDVTIHPGNGRPFRTSPYSRVAQTMNKAYSEVYQTPCSHILLGGSIPIAADLAKASGAEMVLVGVALNTDQIHAPDEHFGIDRLEQGYLTLCRGIQLFG